jgi:hypothetical protein
VRFKTWRSCKDTPTLRPSNPLPVAIRNLGPWTGGPEGELDRLRLPYRVMLGEQGFAIIHSHVSQLQLEAVTSVHTPPGQYRVSDLQGQGRGVTCQRCGPRLGQGAIAEPLERCAPRRDMPDAPANSELVSGTNSKS